MSRLDGLLVGELWRNASAAIAVYDEDRRYLDVNSAFCDLTGYSRDEMLAMQAGDLMALLPLGDTARAPGLLPLSSAPDCATAIRPLPDSIRQETCHECDKRAYCMQ